MERIRRHADAEAIRHVMGGVPARVRALLAGVDFVTDTCPLFIGLHSHQCFEDGRSASEWSHVVLPTAQHQDRPRAERRTTVVLLGGAAYDPLVVLHELGHCLDEALGYRRPWSLPLGAYAERDTYEAFATSFQAWLTPWEGRGDFFPDRTRLREQDPDGFEWFDALAEGRLQ